MASEREKTKPTPHPFLDNIAYILTIERDDSADRIFNKYFPSTHPHFMSSIREEGLRNRFQEEYEERAGQIKQEIFTNIQNKLAFLESKFAMFVEEAWLPIIGLQESNQAWHDPVYREVLDQFLERGGVLPTPSHVEERQVTYDPQNNIDITFIEERFILGEIPWLSAGKSHYQLAYERRTVIDGSAPHAPFPLGHVLEEIGFVRLPDKKNDLSCLD